MNDTSEAVCCLNTKNCTEASPVSRGGDVDLTDTWSCIQFNEPIQLNTKSTAPFNPQIPAAGVLGKTDSALARDNNRECRIPSYNNTLIFNIFILICC